MSVLLLILVSGCSTLHSPSATPIVVRPPFLKEAPVRSMASLKDKTSSQDPSKNVQRQDRRRNVVLMKLRPDATADEVNALKAIYTEYDLRHEKLLLNGRAIRVKIYNSQHSDKEEIVAQKIQATGAVEFVEPDYKVPPAVAPNDSYYSYQWFHQKIGSEAAWNFTQGASAVKVAVCDSGFDLSHPDLGANFVLPGYNTVLNDAEINDVNGHGTETTGLISAIGNNLAGVAGMAWKISILPIQISNQADGSSTYSDVAECIQYATNQAAKVVNISYENIYTSSIVNDAALSLRNSGGLVVVAAGNSGADVSSWGASPNLIVVGATDSNDSLAYFSNFGTPVDLVAPGVGIYTTAVGGNYNSVDGTSFSTPLVSGTAALIYSLNPNFSASQVEQFILSTTQDLGASGPDLTYAGGRLNAGLAVQKAAATIDTVPPIVSLTAPLKGATVAGTISLTAAASDRGGIAKVEFFMDGTSVGTMAVAPYSVSMNTTNYANGSHSISARATDSSGNSATVAITVNVNNVALQTPSITLDNLAVNGSDSTRSFTGTWCQSSQSGFYGNPALYSCSRSTDTYRFTPVIPADKSYKVYVRYLSNSKNSKTVPVIIKAGSSTTTKRVNMQSGGGTWYLLGTYGLKAGQGNYVQLSDSSGQVNVDGVLFEPLN
jgi:thermitase